LNEKLNSLTSLNIYKNLSHRKKCLGINTLAVFMTSLIGTSYFVNKCSAG
jgi:hypothetical protein